MSIKIEQRPVPDVIWPDTAPLITRLLSARGIDDEAQTKLSLKDLHHFESLPMIDLAVERLIKAYEAKQSIWIVGDYDVDGATSTSLMMRALNSLGFDQVDYFIPNRFTYGYGLSAKIIDHLAPQKPDLIITVDNGIVSYEGVDRANALGIDVIVTDHHLAGETLPNAIAVVNPNQPGNTFPSQNLAGVGVAFYVVAALRSAMVAKEIDAAKTYSMQTLLDLVAIGTIADLVPLDANNRTLIAHGLKRIRSGQMLPGVSALIQVAKKNHQYLTAADIAFTIAPRLNAAGRLDDMSTGVTCLLAQSETDGLKAASLLDNLNEERRTIEKSMKQEASELVKSMSFDGHALCLYQEDWHEGLIGLVASKVKEQVNRPVIIFTKDDAGDLKGSGRSIEGFHIQKALSQIDANHPGLITKFGGHAMAAGLSLSACNFESFKKAFEHACKAQLEGKDLTPVVLSDGPLSQSELNLQAFDLIDTYGPWGQGFPEPLFSGVFYVQDQHLVGGAHLKLSVSLEQGGRGVDAICFFVDPNQWPKHQAKKLMLVYQLSDNRFRGRRKLQLIIRHLLVVED